MKKLSIMLFIALSMTTFSFFDKIKSEIQLKLEDAPRFENIKTTKNGKITVKPIKPGTYNVKIYELNYSGDIFEKNRFFNILGEFLETKMKNGKPISDEKYSIIINNLLYNDLKKAKAESFFDEEEILGLPASSLNDYQKAQLAEMTKKLNLSEYIGTDQEYLNRQIYMLYMLLNMKNYEVNKVYSELDKELLVKQLKDARKKTADLFEQSGIEYFIQESFVNTNLNKFTDDSLYKFDKDVVISEKIEDQAILPEIDENVYITAFDANLIDSLVQNKLKLRRKLLLLENSKYQGYTYNEENTVIFTGDGESKVYYYPDYKINVVKKDIDISDLENVNSEYYISDFFK